MRFQLSAVFFVLTLAGCTSVQLESSTIALTPSINQLEKEQIYANLSLFIDSCANADCNAIPNQFVLGGGQAQVSNQIQAPNATANFQGILLKTITLQNQNQWTQTWSITPVTDYSDLERLRALYRFAISLPDPANCDSAGVNSFVQGYTQTQVKSIDPNTVQVSKLFTAAPIVAGVTVDQVPMPLPSLDNMGNIILQSDQWQHPLACRKWVYWDQEPPKAAKAIHVGRFGHHDLYIVDGALEEFIVWIAGATPNTSGGGGGKGGSQKPGGAPGLTLPPISQ